MAKELEESQKEVARMWEDIKKKKVEEEFREKKWREGRHASEKLESDMRMEI